MARTGFVAASEALAKKDRIMRRLVKLYGPVKIPRSTEAHFHALAESIVYQQLAGKAAAAIFGRFRALFDGELSPEAVLATPEAALRGAVARVCAAVEKTSGVATRTSAPRTIGRIMGWP